MNIKTSQFTKPCKDNLLKQQISQKIMLLLQHSDFLAMWCRSNIIFCDICCFSLRVVLVNCEVSYIDQHLDWQQHQLCFVSVHCLTAVISKTFTRCMCAAGNWLSRCSVVLVVLSSAVLKTMTVCASPATNQWHQVFISSNITCMQSSHTQTHWVTRWCSG